MSEFTLLQCYRMSFGKHFETLLRSIAVLLSLKSNSSSEVYCCDSVINILLVRSLSKFIYQSPDRHQTGQSRKKESQQRESQQHFKKVTTMDSNCEVYILYVKRWLLSISNNLPIYCNNLVSKITVKLWCVSQQLIYTSEL